MVIRNFSPQAPSSQYRRVLRSGSALVEQDCKKVSDGITPVATANSPSLHQLKSTSDDVKPVPVKPLISSVDGSHQLQQPVPHNDSSGPTTVGGSSISRRPIPPKKPVNRPAATFRGLQPIETPIASPVPVKSSKPCPDGANSLKLGAADTEQPRPATTDIQLLEFNRKRGTRFTRDSQPQRMIDDMIPPRGQVFQHRRRIEGLDRSPSSFEHEKPTYSEFDLSKIQTPNDSSQPPLKRKVESHEPSEHQQKRRLRIVGGPGSQPNTPGPQSPVARQRQSYNDLKIPSTSSPRSRRSTVTPLRDVSMGFGRLNVIGSPGSSQTMAESRSAEASRFDNLHVRPAASIHGSRSQENSARDTPLPRASYSDARRLSDDPSTFDSKSQSQQKEYAGLPGIDSQREIFTMQGAQFTKRQAWNSNPISPPAQTTGIHTRLSEATSNTAKRGTTQETSSSRVDTMKTIASIQFEIVVKAGSDMEPNGMGKFPLRLETAINVKTPASENIKVIEGDLSRGI